MEFDCWLWKEMESYSMHGKFPVKKDEFDNFRKRQLNFRAWKLEKVMEEIMENHGI